MVCRFSPKFRQYTGHTRLDGCTLDYTHPSLFSWQQFKLSHAHSDIKNVVVYGYNIAERCIEIIKILKTTEWRYVIYATDESCREL